MQLAIVADDLTGALDVSAPIAAHGLRVVVAASPDATDQAVSSGADVVVVNTLSREGSVEDARIAVATVSQKLAAARPLLALKKVDSRLKGHVAVEVEAMMVAFGRSKAVVAPAVPSQGRTVEAGRVIGSGVASPISISSVMGDIPFEAPDTADMGELDSLVRNLASDALPVGASGLGLAVARLLGRNSASLLQPVGPLLVAVGSHDPITLRQVDVAIAGRAFNHLVSRDGSLAEAGDGPLLAQAMVPRDGDFAAAMARFGRSVADILREGKFATALLTGGETAQSVLRELDIDCLEVLGEVLPGIAAARALSGERNLTILTKSGGFGTPDDILRLAAATQGTVSFTDYALAGGQ